MKDYKGYQPTYEELKPLYGADADHDRVVTSLPMRN